MSAPIYGRRDDSRRIVAPTGLNSNQRGYAEVDLNVTVVHRESWGTTGHTYRVIGQSDPLNSYSREAIDAAYATATARAQAAADRIKLDQPDDKGRY